MSPFSGGCLMGAGHRNETARRRAVRGWAGHRGWRGVAMGVGLRRLGVGHFTIFEQQSGIGGTWWDNVYPGAGGGHGAAAVLVQLFSIRFLDHISRRSSAAIPETTADRFGLGSHFQFGDQSGASGRGRTD